MSSSGLMTSDQNCSLQAWYCPGGILGKDCSARRKHQSKSILMQICPSFTCFSLLSFSTLKPPVRWIGGAPESWSHLWSPRHDCHHSLCIDHTTLCRRQFWALEYPFKEEDTTGQMGGEALFFLFIKQDLSSTSWIDLTLPSLNTNSQLWNLWVYFWFSVFVTCVL